MDEDAARIRNVVGSKLDDIRFDGVQLLNARYPRDIGVYDYRPDMLVQGVLNMLGGAETLSALRGQGLLYGSQEELKDYLVGLDWGRRVQTLEHHDSRENFVHAMISSARLASAQEATEYIADNQAVGPKGKDNFPLLHAYGLMAETNNKNYMGRKLFNDSTSAELYRLRDTSMFGFFDIDTGEKSSLEYRIEAQMGKHLRKTAEKYFQLKPITKIPVVSLE